MASGDEQWERHARAWAHKNAWRWDGSIQQHERERQKMAKTKVTTIPIPHTEMDEPFRKAIRPAERILTVVKVLQAIGEYREPEETDVLSRAEDTEKRKAAVLEAANALDTEAVSMLTRLAQALLTLATMPS